MKTLLSPLRVALAIALLVTASIGFIFIPPDARLPVHWNAEGVADGFAARNPALLMPVIMSAATWILFALIVRFANIKDVDAGRRPIGASITGFGILWLVIEVGTVLIGLGVAINMMQAIAMAAGVLLILLGGALPKSKPNSLIGLRLPPTMRDPANWQATHRLTGALWTVGGGLTIIVALFVPATPLPWVMIASFIVPPLVGTAYSYRYERQHRQP